MDPIQDIILNEKLKYLDICNAKRIEIAKKYTELIKSDQRLKSLRTQYHEEPWTKNKNVYHIYPVEIEKIYRDPLQKFLAARGIPTIIHYPIPIHKTTPFNYLDNELLEFTNIICDRILSLPMHPFLTDEEITHVITSIGDFYANPFQGITISRSS